MVLNYMLNRFFAINCEIRSFSLLKLVGGLNKSVLTPATFGPPLTHTICLPTWSRALVYIMSLVQTKQSYRNLLLEVVLVLF